MAWTVSVSDDEDGSPCPMWWTVFLPLALTLVRMAALAWDPPPVEYDPSFRTATPSRSLVSFSVTPLLSSFLCSYTDPILGTGRDVPAFLVETASAALLVVCAGLGWQGRKLGLQIAFGLALAQTAGVGYLGGGLWVLLMLFPTLLVGLGLAGAD